MNASGNQVTVIGQDNTVTSTGSSSADTQGAGSTSGPVTSGKDGIGSGNQTGLAAVPVTATGDQLTVIGQHNTLTSTGTTTTGGSTGPGGTTTGENGGGSGNRPSRSSRPGEQFGEPGDRDRAGQHRHLHQHHHDRWHHHGWRYDVPARWLVVSPPISGSSTGSTGAQAVSAPVDTGLPNTGAPADLLGAGLLGLLLMLLGGSIVRREGAGQ